MLYFIDIHSMGTFMTKPLAYTVGEPAGIGANIILQLAQNTDLTDVVVIGNAEQLRARAERLKMPWPATLHIESVPLSEPDVIGQPKTQNADDILAMLDRAIDGCMNGEFSAMITGPLHKGIINDAGHAFSGHTEYLAMRTGAVQPVMLLATRQLKVGLVTTHLPLKDVSSSLSEQLICQVCRTIDHDLRHKFGIAQPTLAVCGLNPHAGESGHLGTEEIEIIEPALTKLAKEGLNVKGPLPADTAFTPQQLDTADVVVAMYHDQGLPVLKSQGFGEAANITLGLPIIRTSVDHGTALNLAATSKANTGGLQMALQIARDMVNAQQTTP